MLLGGAKDEHFSCFLCSCQLGLSKQQSKSFLIGTRPKLSWDIRNVWNANFLLQETNLKGKYYLPEQYILAPSHNSPDNILTTWKNAKLKWTKLSFMVSSKMTLKVVLSLLDHQKDELNFCLSTWNVILWFVLLCFDSMNKADQTSSIIWVW